MATDASRIPLWVSLQINKDIVKTESKVNNKNKLYSLYTRRNDFQQSMILVLLLIKT